MPSPTNQREGSFHAHLLIRVGCFRRQQAKTQAFQEHNHVKEMVFKVLPLSVRNPPSSLMRQAEQDDHLQVKMTKWSWTWVKLPEATQLIRSKGD